MIFGCSRGTVKSRFFFRVADPAAPKPQSRNPFPMEVATTYLSIAADVLPRVDYAALWHDAAHCEVLYLSLFFIAMKFILRPLGDKGQARLKSLFTLYNLLMSVYSLVSFLVMGYVLVDIGVFGGDCEKAFNNDVFRITALLFYISKYVEYIDSFYVLLTAKPLTFLQFFHHLGAPIDLWLFVQYRNESLWIFVFLNGFIHFVMYGYYWARLVKLPFPLPKSFITSMQIIQFNVGFYLVWRYHTIPCYRQDPMRMFAWLFNYFYVGVVLLLFLNFYVHTYVIKKSRRVKKEEVKTE